MFNDHFHNFQKRVTVFITSHKYFTPFSQQQKRENVLTQDIRLMKYLVELLSEKSGRRSQLPLLLFIDKKILDVTQFFKNNYEIKNKNIVSHMIR